MTGMVDVPQRSEDAKGIEDDDQRQQDVAINM